MPVVEEGASSRSATTNGTTNGAPATANSSRTGTDDGVAGKSKMRGYDDAAAKAKVQASPSSSEGGSNYHPFISWPPAVAVRVNPK